MIDESKDNSFFCMKLVGFIEKHEADYIEVFRFAKAGECPYKDECEIYKRTIEKKPGDQLDLFR